MDPELIFRIEGADLEWLKSVLIDRTQTKIDLLRIYVEGTQLKFKINEHIWTVPMGISEAAHERIEREMNG